MGKKEKIRGTRKPTKHNNFASAETLGKSSAPSARPTPTPPPCILPTQVDPLLSLSKCTSTDQEGGTHKDTSSINIATTTVHHVHAAAIAVTPANKTNDVPKLPPPTPFRT